MTKKPPYVIDDPAGHLIDDPKGNLRFMTREEHDRAHGFVSAKAPTRARKFASAARNRVRRTFLAKSQGEG